MDRYMLDTVQTETAPKIGQGKAERSDGTEWNGTIFAYLDKL
jgi:hypothetical protein